MNEQMNGNMGSGMGKNVCGCKHHMVGPVGKIAIGALFILMSFGWITGTWPLLIVGLLFVAMGIMKMKARKCSCC